MIILLPDSGFSTTQAAALTSFVSGGGRLVISGDWETSGSSGFYTHSDYINALMSRMGVSMRLGTSTVSGSGCNTTTSITTDQLTASTGRLHLAASTTVSGGTALATYSGSTFLAVDQPSTTSTSRTPYDVLLSGDTNLFTDYCTGSTSTGRNWTLWENLYICPDDDGDGYEDDACGGTDCDDSDASINPGEDEYCDGVDNDCDGSTDEASAVDASTWYRDYDGDGWGNPRASTTACYEPSGYTDVEDDCDDTDADINPDAEEIPYDGVDDDCDGADLTDVDGDGYDAAAVGGTDCDDTDADVNTSASETADGVDEDCDGTVDEGTSAYDDDGDGWTEDGGDCSDTDASRHPGATETADGVDEDCDGTVDEGTDAYDDDGDGWTEDGGDCNDGDADVSPSETEVPDNGVDDDCDGVVDDGAFDPDGDGYTSEGGDCDETDATVYPGAPELPDGVDDDCDGRVDEDSSDVDGDGYTLGDGDCDDEEGWANPGLPEFCDLIDNDCDGDVDEGCDDLTPVDTGEAGKGCTTAPTGAGWLVLPLVLLALRRRSPESRSRGVHPVGALLALLALLATGCGPDVSLTQQKDELLINPDLADFGVVATGDTRTLDLDLVCVEGFDVSILSVDLSNAVGAWFEAGEAPGTVTPESPGTLQLTYHPLSEGYHHGVLTLITDAEPALVELPVRGQASSSLARAWPAVLDFGEVSPEEGSAELSFTLANESSAPLEISALTPSAASFEALASTPLLLSVGQQLEVPVRFSPWDSSAVSAELVLDPPVTAPIQLRANDCEHGAPQVYDRDGDGWTSCGGDCDDDAAHTHPGAPELEDNLDNDCDGITDEGTNAYDDDGDGFSENDDDCNDDDDQVKPHGEEIPDNGIDDDCDGVVDDGSYDPDGDGWTEGAGDCDPYDADVYPGAPEDADGVDDDCDGTTDEGTSAYDDDGDGYSEDDGDCDDTDATISPAATETADGADEDCDGTVDEGTTAADDDGDGFTEEGGDCDDTDDEISPAQLEVEGDGVDNDCDGVAE